MCDRGGQPPHGCQLLDLDELGLGLSQLSGEIAQFSVEARVLEGNGYRASHVVQEPQVVFIKLTIEFVDHLYGADDFVLDLKRHAEYRAGHQADGLVNAWAEARVALGIQHQQRLPFLYHMTGNALTGPQFEAYHTLLAATQNLLEFQQATVFVQQQERSSFYVQDPPDNMHCLAQDLVQVKARGDSFIDFVQGCQFAGVLEELLLHGAHAQHGFYPGQELHGPERFAHIIISANGQAPGCILNRPQARYHDDGDILQVVVLLDHPADLITVHIGYPYVQDHQVNQRPALRGLLDPLLEDFQSLRSTVSWDNGVSLALQQKGDHINRFYFIVHDQYIGFICHYTDLSNSQNFRCKTVSDSPIMSPIVPIRFDSP